MLFKWTIISLLLLSPLFSAYFSSYGSMKNDQNYFAADLKAEENNTSRKRNVSFTTVGFGPSSMRRFGDEKLAYNLYGARFWSIKEYIALGFLGEFTSDLESSSMIGTSITAIFFPFQTDVTPYTSSDIGLGFARAEEKNAFGISMGCSLGVLFFRSSNVQLNIQLKINIVLDKLPEGYPGSFQVRLGFLF